MLLPASSTDLTIVDRNKNKIKRNQLDNLIWTMIGAYYQIKPEVILCVLRDLYFTMLCANVSDQLLVSHKIAQSVSIRNILKPWFVFQSKGISDYLFYLFYFFKGFQRISVIRWLLIISNSHRYHHTYQMLKNSRFFLTFNFSALSNWYFPY